MASTASNQMFLHGYEGMGRGSARATAAHPAWKLPRACRSEIPRLSERRFGSLAHRLVRPLWAALVLGSAAAASAQGSEPSWQREALASLGSDELITAWAAVFAALYVLYAYERTRGPGRNLALRHAVPRKQPAHDAAIARRLVVLRSAAPPVLASSRPLFASPSQAEPAGKRPAGSAVSKRPVGQAKARKKNAPAREKIGLGATQSGEETFSVAEAPASVDRPDCVQRCVTLRAQGRFAEAARLAREGLAVAGDPGLLLVELSRAEFGLGRVNAAIDTARDAYFASPSRESVVHLIRLLTETRRFARDDGPSLRRAVSRHPRQPLLLQAAGVFESMHGKACEAERLLRAALTLAPDEEARRAIARELSRVGQSRAREV
jgi:tetratricopeptide (TPR) repeat protein